MSNQEPPIEVMPAKVAGPPVPSNPFAVQQREVNAGTVSVEEQRAIAEVQGKLIIAKRFPRNMAEAYQKVIDACSRPSLAAQAMYSYAKGGANVTGPSIRLAEELARSMGNIEFGIRELSQRGNASEVQAYAWDLETNTQSIKNFTIKHERHTKRGVTTLTDPRDVYELVANNGGRRLRACILAIMPPDLVEAAIEQCTRTQKGEVSANLEDSKRNLVAAFKELGITVQHLQDNRGKTVAEFLPDDIVELRNIYRTIRDGHAKAADFFEKRETEAAAGLNQAIKQQATEPQPAAQPAQPAAQPVPPAQQPQTVASAPPPTSTDDIL